jgi:cell division transport system permease protein
MLSFVAFSLKGAWQGFWRNAVMSLAATATMVLMLVLLSAFFVVLSGLDAGLQFVEQKVQVVAELRDDAPDLKIAQLKADISALPEVATVEYIDKAAALAEFKQRMAEQGREDLTQYLDSNPLPASLNITLKDPHDFGSVVQVLQARTDVVQTVEQVQDLVDRVLTVTNLLRTVGLVLLGLVGLTVLFIIINTIRLAVVARSEEIEIMRLVGASDAFIRWPFIFEGAMVGLFGALITLMLLAAGAAPLSSLMTRFFEVLPLQVGSISRDLVIIVLATGIGLGTIGSWVSVRSYLLK